MDSTLLLATIAKLLFVVVVVILLFSPLMAWADRRLCAMIQDRLGPIRANIPIGDKKIALAGLLHPLADAVKFIWKEDFVPPRADKLLHALAPIIAFIPTVAAFAVIPFGGTLYPQHLLEVLPAAPSGPAIPLQVASLNVGILFIFAIGGTGVVGAAIAGYASDNKYALLGGIRAASQMVSYEVTLGLSLVGCFMLYGSLLLEDMINWQIQHAWGIFVQPLAFILFFTASVAETKRIPFDIPEGESELAAGYFTEYSGMKFGMFFMSEYIQIIGSSFLLVAIFFGGYDVPFLYQDGVHVHILGRTLLDIPLNHLTVTILNVVNYLIKVVLVCWLTLMVRWSLPRFRYDQVMKLCWRYMLPLSLANIFVTGVFVLFFQR